MTTKLFSGLSLKLANATLIRLVRFECVSRLLPGPAGKIVFSHQLEGTFGADLLSQVEAKVSAFLQTLVHYYDAKLSTISDPVGAEVWIDGRNLGQTPTGNLTIAANQQLNLAIKKKGYLTYNRVIEVQSRQYTIIHALLYDRITDQLLKQQRHL